MKLNKETILKYMDVKNYLFISFACSRSTVAQVRVFKLSTSCHRICQRTRRTMRGTAGHRTSTTMRAVFKGGRQITHLTIYVTRTSGKRIVR